MPTSVALGAHFEAFIKDQLVNGRYNNASEIVRDGLRLLEEKQEERAVRLEALRAEINKGLDSGPSVSAEDAFARVRKAIQSVARSKTGE